ncbi:outer membrane lipoprotein carrier protein LolA [Sediminibacterium sp.]|uniref:LolA family protein n=1 Tax=Sediminibacterium sp. TaxID=1917865 RepID=UPI002733A518|nr:outer membrane lipoprotein carrier protein LolA [Sediminibacterium sp.]MDP3393670.1 outer membrane lipoprotein carrier protein LolA [Sediminibacterium sp.]MDP3566557.1 outer membrane lipoprotein carrier protein LolA [Sediminibacterium sp.]
MQKFYIASIFIFCSFLFTNAQNDPAAKKVIDAFGSKVKASKGITASFSLKSFNSKGKANGTKSLSLSMRGEKYLLKQGKTEIICDGKNVYNFDGAKTITKSAVEENSQTLSPQKLLAGSYDKDFSYKLTNTKGNFNEIEMVPLDKRKNFQKVTLFFNKKTSVLSKASILDKSNNITELGVSNINLSAKLADILFVFNKANYPKDVEILD